MFSDAKFGVPTCNLLLIKIKLVKVFIGNCKKCPKTLRQLGLFQIPTSFAEHKLISGILIIAKMQNCLKTLYYKV